MRVLRLYAGECPQGSCRDAATSARLGMGTPHLAAVQGEGDISALISRSIALLVNDSFPPEGVVNLSRRKVRATHACAVKSKGECMANMKFLGKIAAIILACTFAAPGAAVANTPAPAAPEAGQCRAEAAQPLMKFRYVDELIGHEMEYTDQRIAQGACLDDLITNFTRSGRYECGKRWCSWVGYMRWNAEERTFRELKDGYYIDDRFIAWL